MEEDHLSTITLDGEITGIRFNLATSQEICTSSVNDCPISHPSQLTNPFLGLPLEYGNCESCGTSEPGKCEGHFGYIQLPVPIYHPCHVSELKHILDLICLKCLRMKMRKVKETSGTERSSSAPCSYCPDLPQLSIKEVKTTDGACYLELKISSRSRSQDGFWNFLERYGFRYGDGSQRTLLPSESLEILKRIPEETRRKLIGKGHFPQYGYILQYLPVPPNCLSVPDISDGISIMSSDLSITMLRKVLKQIEIIRSSRSGAPNFESQEIEANELQSTVANYLHVRGTAKASRDVDTRFSVSKGVNDTCTKAWLEKMRTLFISKGSGFSSRSVITGDAYKGINEIGLPSEVAQRITFEEKVSIHNMDHLQKLVDNKLCLTYTDGLSTYSLRDGSKGYTSLRVGQVVRRRIMDGDIVFINRPPSTHKHSLQAFSVYVHDDHTVKVNPLICGPLGADFDGDCVHLFYPQSLEAKSEVLELFAVQHQLLSSHSGNLNLQLANDSLLSLNILFKRFFFDKASSQQLGMFVPMGLPQPALLKAHHDDPVWTALQILQTALPSCFDSSERRYLISQSEILKFDFNKDALQTSFNEIINSVLFQKGSKEALNVVNSLQPLLMEHIFSVGFSVSLKDFSIPRAVTEELHKMVEVILPLLHHLRSEYNEMVELQVENHLRIVKVPVVKFILKSSILGNLIDSKSDSSINKVVQQVGFLGLQFSDRGKLYSRTLVEALTSFFRSKYCVNRDGESPESFGLISSCFFNGLNPYEELVHSISSREVLVRSSRGLTEPGTLFKNLMAILRDVVICYDGTVRNVCNNSLIQFEYGADLGNTPPSFYPAGEPVGILAATAISNPAYKAVLDSSPSNNSSWELMKEILLCRASFKNDLIDRRVILYLNDCGCGGYYCKEKAAYIVQNHLKRVSLMDIAVDFSIKYQKQCIFPGNSVTNAGLVGHIHLDKMSLKALNRSMADILKDCQETLNSFRKKKDQLGHILRRVLLLVSECCSVRLPDKERSEFPCLQFLWEDTSSDSIQRISKIMANKVCPILLGTNIKGDPQVLSANIMWTSPDVCSWVRNPCKIQNGELVLEVVVDKAAVKRTGDAWRVVLNSCLPVIHLVDTRRSIPYGIKQIQELLGISCAFDQAVQRLSSSVRMVTKGVLKEHLILAANSMTCTGNMIGFNSGGYKALLRSLNVHVPFTEATLFTPRKCFEKAAQKCHMDSLSSIVASCSWGKHVTVGTGAQFEILWNNKEMGVNQDGEIDVYDFLQLVRGSNEGDSFTTCLGQEIDDLELENEERELSLSPNVNTCFNKPVFDDNGCLGEDSWGKQAEKEGINGWDKNEKQPEGGQQWELHSWDTNMEQKQASQPKGSLGWGSSEPVDWTGKEVTQGWQLKQSSVKLQTWKGKVEEVGKSSWEINEQQSSLTQQGERSNWDIIVEQKQGNQCSLDWDSLKSSNTTKSETKTQGWQSKEPPVKSLTWEGQAEGVNRSDWNDNKQECDWGQLRVSTTCDTNVAQKQGTQPCLGWGSPKSSGRTKNELRTEDWQLKESPIKSYTWKEWTKETDGSGWCGNDQQSDLPQQMESSTWVTSIAQKGSQPSHGWGSSTSSNKTKREMKTEGWKLKESVVKQQTWKDQVLGTDRSGWDRNEQQLDSVDWEQGKSTTWDSNLTPKQQSQPSLGWNSPKSSDGGRNENKTKGWELKEPMKSQNWEEQTSQQGSEAHLQWGQSSGSPIKSHGWGTNVMKKPLKQPTSSRTWGSGDWKNKKNRTPGKLDSGNDCNSSGIFTVNRQRFDVFTSEEQNILSKIEPIMQSIKRIMHQSRYNDGDRLSIEDQSFVLENVFNYHPDKAIKMGDGIDYVMVDKHSSFQSSRCFYIVLTNGHQEDFSYLKCLENFIKERYPGIGESFVRKYFKRHRSGGVLERE